MKDLTVKQWTEALGSKDGKYGGGSAASVVGAFGTNLAQYVFELQQGKEKYADKEDVIQDGIERCIKLSDELLELAEVDADAFEPVLPLYKLPQDTEEQRIERQKKIDKGLERAAQPPLDIMKKMNDVMDLHELLLELEVKGTIVDDISVGLIFTEAAIESQKINCDINIKMIKDDSLRTEMTEEVEEVYFRLLERCRQLKEATVNIHDHNM